MRWRCSAATAAATSSCGARPRTASMAALDYLAPGRGQAADRRRRGAARRATSECVLPAEVAAASPAGMVTMIGYGPEANFAEKPKAPKWTAKVRFKTTASVMHGMGAMMGGGGDDRRRGGGAAARAAQEEETRVRDRRPVWARCRTSARRTRSSSGFRRRLHSVHGGGRGDVHADNSGGRDRVRDHVDGEEYG